MTVSISWDQFLQVCNDSEHAPLILPRFRRSLTKLGFTEKRDSEDDALFHAVKNVLDVISFASLSLSCGPSREGLRSSRHPIPLLGYDDMSESPLHSRHGSIIVRSFAQVLDAVVVQIALDLCIQLVPCRRACSKVEMSSLMRVGFASQPSMFMVISVCGPSDRIIGVGSAGLVDGHEAVFNFMPQVRRGPVD